jgi:hypothetical protein
VQTIGRPVVLFLFVLAARQLVAQESLEQRQPLELMYADSIVPQDRHEMMLTTGVWHSRDDAIRASSLTQKLEWGLSDQLQISTFIHALDRSNLGGTIVAAVGDMEIGARYSWARAGSELSHVAIALDVGLPTGSARTGLSEDVYHVSPSVLLSRELGGGRWQLFSTTGVELAARGRHAVFSNSGVSTRAGRGWAVAELHVSRESDSEVSIAPSYVWRLARRAEILVGFPIGVTSAAPRRGAVVKFTFELGGGD